MVLSLWRRDPKPLQNVVKNGVYVYMALLLLTYHTLYTKGYNHRIQYGPPNYRWPTNA
jgi:hypothetical protein